MTNAFTAKPDLSKFTQKLRHSTAASKTGSRVAQLHNVAQSPALPIFTHQQRSPRAKKP